MMLQFLQPSESADLQLQLVHEDAKMSQESRFHSMYVSPFSRVLWKSLSISMVLLVIVFTSRYIWQRCKYRYVKPNAKSRQKRHQTNQDKRTASQTEQEPMLQSPEKADSEVELASSSIDPDIEDPPVLQVERIRQPSIANFELQLNHLARLHEKRFESMWEEYSEREKWSNFPETLPSLNTVIDRLEEKGMKCIASGTVQMKHKGFFFANQNRTTYYVLCEVTLNTVTQQANMVIRAPKDAPQGLVEAITALVKQSSGR